MKLGKWVVAHTVKELLDPGKDFILMFKNSLFYSGEALGSDLHFKSTQEGLAWRKVKVEVGVPQGTPVDGTSAEEKGQCVLEGDLRCLADGPDMVSQRKSRMTPRI
jgi:hypothetical protein